MKLFKLNITRKLSRCFSLVIISMLLFNVITLAQNPIVTENALAGNASSEWDIPKLAGDSTIQGFATDLSVNKGQTVYFKIKTDARAYTINIYRIGYYGGKGARKAGVGTITASLPQIQPAPVKDVSTGLVDCGNWAVSAEWQVPASAVSGVYIAKLTRSDNGGASHIIFIVRDDTSTSDLYFKTSDPTWQAYNAYGGYNLYGGSTSYPQGRAVKVSYNRPLITRGGGFGTDAYANGFFNSEYPMIRWLEQNGYNVSYFTSVDAARYSSLMKNHKVCLSVGHDEYWSSEQRSAFEAARDAGVHLAFFSGNEVYWKTRWEPDGNGTPYKTLVCYKEGASGEYTCSGKCDPMPNVWTGQWRSGCNYPAADGCNPENPLSGQMSWYGVNPGVAISVPSTYKGFRFWRNTGIASGKTNTLTNGVLGFEIDWEQNDYKSYYPPGRVTMSETTVAPGITHKLSLYRHTKGALVFGAGTIQWAWGLTSVHDGITTSVADPNMQQATVNLFADMNVQPVTLQTGLVAAVSVTDRKPPVTVFTTSNGTAAVVGNAVSIAGTATEDAGIVAGVEVSADGGVSWQSATGFTNSKVANWSYSWMPADTGTYTILSRAFDDMGNLETQGSSIAITVKSSGTTSCPCNIFVSSAIPAQAGTAYSGGWPDASAIELGVKFRSAVDGYITGIRFYKGSNNTGVHIGNLWSATGTNLARATFTSETASGWQQVSFATPVAIKAGVTYVASYHTNVGYYVSDDSYFTTRHNGTNVYALADGEDGANGVFTYSANTIFPTDSYNASNAWVDVVFNTNAPVDKTPPVITSTSPANQSSNVAINAPVNINFSEALDASTVNGTTVILKNATGSVVAASVVYNSATPSVTITPTQLLNYSTAYTVTLAGGTTDPRIKDVAGNALAGNYSFSFTTAAAPPAVVCPCTIWKPADVPVQAGTAYSGGWPDASAIELGVKFRSAVDGFITGIRFYKGSNNTGVHIGNLWSATGTNLARATFTSETASGWQQVSFATPVAIKAGVTYVASYHTNVGYYVSDDSYFTTRHNGTNVYALADGEDGANGVFSYAANTAFPTNSYNALNAWVDVVFNTSTASNATMMASAKMNELTDKRINLVQISSNADTMALTKINAAENAGSRLTVSPNPTNNRTRVSFTASKESKYLLEVADANGRVVLKKKGWLKSGVNNADLDLSGKANGLYYITLVYKDGQRKTIKLIKAN